MEKVGDSQSSSEPVSSTSKEMMKERQRVLKVEAESAEICLEKIKGVLEKLRERGDIDTWSEETDGMVMVLGCFDPEKLRMELENEAGDAIKSITDTTNIIHIGRDGAVIELENQDVMGQPQGLPEMPVTQVADSSNHEILDHSEEEAMESINSSRPIPRLQTVFRQIVSRGRRRRFRMGKIPKMQVLEVINRRTVIFKHSESKIEPTKNSRSWWQWW